MRGRLGFLALLIALFSSACGASTDSTGACLQNAGTDLNKARGCSHDPKSVGSATVIFDGATQLTVIEDSSPVDEFTIPGRPELSYSGPGGCKARAFDVGRSAHISSAGLFRYSSRDAYLVWRDRVYHFIAGPRRLGGILVFDQRFSGHEIVVKIACPPPPPSGPLLPVSY